ncbi:MAG: hypothetical protein HOP23_04355 [Methylococcaceae bacterium]|nr:hypothetical protein [Methylococcaceae bacterium]
MPDSKASVRSCHRYLSRRMDQLDYPDALTNNLPIGSGEIESAHRYLCPVSTSSKNGSSSRDPGGAPPTPSTCLHCA